MNEDFRNWWEQRHREGIRQTAEPFVLESLPLLPRGLALDIAAGSGRNSLLLGRAGYRVHAIDFSFEGMRRLREAARQEDRAIETIVADLGAFPIPEQRYDLILNINFLDRSLVPKLKRALKPGGAILVETFLVDQAALGHPRNPEFLLRHYELRELLDGLELLRYREGLSVAASGTKAWRAGALALRLH